MTHSVVTPFKEAAVGKTTVRILEFALVLWLSIRLKMKVGMLEKMKMRQIQNKQNNP